jgi:putative flippase GtrA
MAVAIIGLGINEIIMFSLANLIPGGTTDVALMASRVIATIMVFMWNFALNKGLTFRLLR